jgi:hypothetical protein
MPPSDLMCEKPADPCAAAGPGAALSGAAWTAALASAKTARLVHIVVREIRLMLSNILQPTVQPRNHRF